MESEDVINLAESSSAHSDDRKNENGDSNHVLQEVDSGICNSEHREGSVDIEEDMDLTEDDFRNMGGQCIGHTEQVADRVNDASSTQVSVELAETVTVVDKKLEDFSSKFPADGCTNIQDEGLMRVHKKNISSKSGVKRARTTSDEQKPSVHVVYNSLTRASKEKLEQLLRKWSEWQAENGSSAEDSDQVLESGEETYFPALRVGLEKTSSVTFWIDKQKSSKEIKGFPIADSSSAPLYDRGFSLGLTSGDRSNNLEGGLEIMDDPSRCFNCGSYSHSLKECPKPRNHAAVNSARKQYRAKRNQNTGPRLPTRYYQTSQGGKYDDVKPGSLLSETRQLLGLKDLDPPPWLNRMREIGYPPGYLAPDDEDNPSGITIYGDEDVKEEEREDGELDEQAAPPEPRMKMTVDFPGINTPIPENADDRLWAPAPSSSEQSRGRRPRRSTYGSEPEPSTRGYHYEQRPVRDPRDDGPPGVDLMFSSSSYPPRCGRHDYPRCRSPAFERSYSDRRWSPRAHDDHHSSRYSLRRDYDFDDCVRDDRDSFHYRSSLR